MRAPGIKAALILLSTSFFPVFLAINGADADETLGARPAQALRMEVEINGPVPGCSNSELQAYLSSRMSTLTATPRQFVPAAVSQSPSRVIWTFKVLPYAAGTVHYLGPGSTGFVTPPGIPRKMSAAVAIFLNNIPLGTVTGEMSIAGSGPNRPDLDPIISSVLERLSAADPAPPHGHD